MHNILHFCHDPVSETTNCIKDKPILKIKVQLENFWGLECRELSKMPEKNRDVSFTTFVTAVRVKARLWCVRGIWTEVPLAFLLVQNKPSCSQMLLCRSSQNIRAQCALDCKQQKSQSVKEKNWMLRSRERITYLFLTK